MLNNKQSSWMRNLHIVGYQLHQGRLLILHTNYCSRLVYIVMQCIHNNYTCNMHTYKVTINCTAGCQHSKFITSYLPISDPFSALCCSLIHLMDCLSLYLCILSVMYSEVVITWLESRNLAELFMNGSSCKFIQWSPWFVAWIVYS